MTCKHCNARNIPYVASNNMRMHDIWPERYYCEDQEPKSYDRLSPEEKKRLFLIAEIASEVRMEHAVPLFRAIDWTREVMANGEIVQESDRKTAIKYVLDKFGHTCDRSCGEAKKVE